MREFDVQYAIHDDVSIAYAVFGEGPRDVLLQQNLCPVDLLGELPQLALFLDALGSVARVIAYDPRGAGASDSIVDPISHIRLSRRCNPVGAGPPVESR